MSWFTVLRLLLLQKRSWMTQHFYQAKMLPSNDSFHKSLLFSKSFKVFHCSVINVLLLSSAVSLSDSLFIIAPLSSFVNNFFHLFQKSFWGLPPGSLLLLFLFRFGACRLISDSFVIPVSYTHLDVYKRQNVHNTCILTDFAAFRQILTHHAFQIYYIWLNLKFLIHHTMHFS